MKKKPENSLNEYVMSITTVDEKSKKCDINYEPIL